MRRNNLLFVEDIIEAIHKIEEFSEGLNSQKFVKDELRQSAVIRQLEIIGEAVKSLSEEFKNKYPLVEWRKIAGFRDVLIHAYFGTDIIRIWNVIKNDLPKLKKDINEILEKESNDK